MANIKQQIIDWFNGPQDFNQGVMLLEQVSRKNKILAKLMRRGETRSSYEKLVWELNKTAGLREIPARKAVKASSKMPKTKKVKAAVITSEGNTDGNEKIKYNLIGEKDLSSYPPEANRLVKEYSSLYMQRGKKHAALGKVGDGNSDQQIADRKVLVDEIAVINARMEELYEAFHDFEENGEPVDVAQLWPEPKAMGPEKIHTVEELKNLKKNIQSSMTKDRNILLYGSKTKPKNGKESPLPAGAKRITLEKRISKKEAEISELDIRIAKMG